MMQPKTLACLFVFGFIFAVNGEILLRQDPSASERLKDQELSKIIEACMAHWMVGDDQESFDIRLKSRAVLEESIPRWYDITSFAEGMIRSTC